MIFDQNFAIPIPQAVPEESKEIPYRDLDPIHKVQVIHQLHNVIASSERPKVTLHRTKFAVGFDKNSSASAIHTFFKCCLSTTRPSAHLAPPFSTLLVRPPAVAPLALLLSTVLARIRTERTPTFALALLRATLAAVPRAALPVRAQTRNHRCRRRCSGAVRNGRHAPTRTRRGRCPCRRGRRERSHLPVHDVRRMHVSVWRERVRGVRVVGVRRRHDRRVLHLLGQRRRRRRRRGWCGPLLGGGCRVQ